MKEGERTYFWNDGFDVDVVANDGGIVAAEFQSHSFEGWRCGCHDLFAGGSGACEGYFVDIRVGGEKRPQILFAAESLHHTWWEDLGAEFGELKVAVWGIWRRLDDDCVACDQCWSDLTHCQQDWVVPRDYTADDSQRYMSMDDLPILGVFKDFVRDFHGAEGSEPSRSHPNLLI